MNSGKIQRWKKLSSKAMANYRVFNIRSDLKVSPRTGREHDFYVIEAVNWVHVIALTREGKLVMVEQYRHGSDTIELELAGGMIDPSDVSPLEAGLRELREETGYEGAKAEIIGQIYANPAIMNNICYTVLVRDCELRHNPELDHAEDLAVTLVDVADIPRLIQQGRIGHSLVVVGLYYFELWRAANSSPPTQSS
jgi:8-oxo-dGTP pyrophosphatase MutT (NUDIX family)